MGLLYGIIFLLNLELRLLFLGDGEIVKDVDCWKIKKYEKLVPDLLFCFVEEFCDSEGVVYLFY